MDDLHKFWTLGLAPDPSDSNSIYSFFLTVLLTHLQFTYISLASTQFVYYWTSSFTLKMLIHFNLIL